MKLEYKLIKNHFGRIIELLFFLAAVVAATFYINDKMDVKIQAAENRATIAIHEVKDDLGERIDEVKTDLGWRIDKVVNRLDKIIEIQLGK